MKCKKDFQSIKDTFKKENDEKEDLRKILQDLEKYKTNCDSRVVIKRPDLIKRFKRLWENK